MIQASIKNSALPALCGILYAVFSVTIFLMGSPDGSSMLRDLLETRNTVALMGIVALAAGACTSAAAFLTARRAGRWLLLQNGLACGALGLLIMLGANRAVAFRTLALAVAVMAASLGLYQLATARAFRGHPANQWLLGAAGLVSTGFALVFLAFALRWFPLDPSPSAQTFNWLASYFAFSAICMAGLALDPLKPRADLPPLVSTALPPA